MRMKLLKSVKLILCLTFLLGGLASPTPARTQCGDPDEQGNYWRHYNTSNSSLLSNNIRVITYIEDSIIDGTIPGLWLGTDGGLSYTNGRNWVNYTTANSPLPSNNIRSIITTTQAGEIWIATSSGIAYLDYASTPQKREDDTWEIFTTNEGLPNEDVFKLTLAGNNGIWAGVDGGIAFFDGTTWHDHTDGLPNPNIHDLAYDASNNTLWAITNTGLGALNVETKTWAIYDFDNKYSALPNKQMHTLEVSKAGHVWIGAAGGIATLSSDGTWEIWLSANIPNLPNYPITDLSLDPTERYLWIATDGGGASRYDISTNQWHEVNTANSELPNDHVRAILASHKNTMWLSTWAGLSGTERIWETLSFSDQVLSGWAHPESDKIWIGTENGRVLYSPDGGKSWNSFLPAKELRGHDIRAIWGNGTNTVWIGMDGGGLIRSDEKGKEWQIFTTTHGLSSNEIWAIWGDHTSTIWVGTWGAGINRSDDRGKNWQSFTTADGLGSNEIWAIGGDNDNTVWVAALDGGVSCSNNGGRSWRTYTTVNGLGSDDVRAVWVSNTGVVWVGTSNGVTGHSI